MDTRVNKLVIGFRVNRDGMELGSVTLKRIGFFCFLLNTQHTLIIRIFIFTTTSVACSSAAAGTRQARNRRTTGGTKGGGGTCFPLRLRAACWPTDEQLAIPLYHDKTQFVCVYYCSTPYKAVRVGGGHVLRETTSQGLCGGTRE